MSKHRVVKSDFWTDDYIEELTIVQRYFFLYLLTNPNTNILGVYQTTLKRMCFESGLDENQIENCLFKFKEDDKVYFIHNHILMVNFQSHQNPNDKMKVGIAYLLNSLPKEVYGFIMSEKSRIYDRLSKPIKAYAYLHINKDIDINKNKDINKGSFKRFWSVYPRKKSKGQAEKTFSKINPTEELLLEIISSIEKQKKSEQWVKNNGQFIPYPATWLNAKGWEDENEETVRNNRQTNPMPREFL